MEATRNLKKGDVDMIDESIKEFEALCKPVVDYLRKNHNPHSKVIITDDSAVLLSTELGVPYFEKEND